MPSTDRKLELKAKTSVAQTASQAAVYAKGLNSDMQLAISSKYEISFTFFINAIHYNIQSDQNVSVHLMITGKNTRKNILNSFNHLPS
jgi:hypothetical protein